MSTGSVQAVRTGDDSAGKSRHFRVSFRTGLIGGSIVLAMIQANATKFAIAPDGISYLDLGAALTRGDWPKAISSYWGPVYPWLLGICVAVFHAQGLQQFAVAHALNVLFFALTLLVFDRIWTKVLANIVASDESKLLRSSVLYLGYAAFSCSFVPMIGLVTPDLLLSAVILSIGFCFWKWIATEEQRWLLAAGVLLGTGYLIKSIMLPVGLVTLFATFILMLVRSRNIRPLLLATSIFLLISSPLVICLSARAKRLTIGDAGRLNYAWFVSNPSVGDSFLEQRAFFPLGSVISDEPRVFAIPTQAHVTFLPWFDPGQLTKNVKAKFHFRNQVKRLSLGLLDYRNFVLLSGYEFLLIAILILAWMGKPSQAYSDFILFLTIWFFAAGALSAYGLVLVEPRYINAFWCLSIASALAISLRNLNAKHRIAGRVMFVAAVLFTFQALPGLRHSLINSGDVAYPVQARVAAALRANGLSNGDKVAVIDWPYYQAPWAKLANASISAYVPTAEIPYVCRNHEVPSANFLETVKFTGARWIITSADIRGCDEGWWNPVPATAYHFKKIE